MSNKKEKNRNHVRRAAWIPDMPGTATRPITYREVQHGCEAAYKKWKKENPTENDSVLAFVAGFNAGRYKELPE